VKLNITLKNDSVHFLKLLNQNPPPACLKPADKEIRKGLADYEAGAQTAINGLDDNSVSEVQSGTQQLAQGTTAFDNASKDILNSTC
jgi:hypothetical protein